MRRIQPRGLSSNRLFVNRRTSNKDSPPEHEDIKERFIDSIDFAKTSTFQHASHISLSQLAQILDYELSRQPWFTTGHVNPIYFSKDFVATDIDGKKYDDIRTYARAMIHQYDQDVSKAQIISCEQSCSNIITVTSRISGRKNVGIGGIEKIVDLKPYLQYTDYTVSSKAGLILSQTDRASIPSWDIYLSSSMPIMNQLLAAEPAQEVPNRVVKRPNIMSTLSAGDFINPLLSKSNEISQAHIFDTKVTDHMKKFLSAGNLMSALLPKKSVKKKKSIFEHAGNSEAITKPDSLNDAVEDYLKVLSSGNLADLNADHLNNLLQEIETECASSTSKENLDDSDAPTLLDLEQKKDEEIPQALDIIEKSNTELLSSNSLRKSAQVLDIAEESNIELTSVANFDENLQALDDIKEDNISSEQLNERISTNKSGQALDNAVDDYINLISSGDLTDLDVNSLQVALNGIEANCDSNSKSKEENTKSLQGAECYFLTSDSDIDNKYPTEETEIKTTLPRSSINSIRGVKSENTNRSNDVVNIIGNVFQKNTDENGIQNNVALGLVKKTFSRVSSMAAEIDPNSIKHAAKKSMNTLSSIGKGVMSTANFFGSMVNEVDKSIEKASRTRSIIRKESKKKTQGIEQTTQKTKTKAIDDVIGDYINALASGELLKFDEEELTSALNKIESHCTGISDITSPAKVEAILHSSETKTEDSGEAVVDYLRQLESKTLSNRKDKTYLNSLSTRHSKPASFSVDYLSSLGSTRSFNAFQSNNLPYKPPSRFASSEISISDDPNRESINKPSNNGTPMKIYASNELDNKLQKSIPGQKADEVLAKITEKATYIEGADLKVLKESTKTDSFLHTPIVVQDESITLEIGCSGVMESFSSTEGKTDDELIKRTITPHLSAPKKVEKDCSNSGEGIFDTDSEQVESSLRAFEDNLIDAEAEYISLLETARAPKDTEGAIAGFSDSKINLTFSPPRSSEVNPLELEDRDQRPSLSSNAADSYGRAYLATLSVSSKISATKPDATDDCQPSLYSEMNDRHISAWDNNMPCVPVLKEAWSNSNDSDSLNNDTTQLTSTASTSYLDSLNGSTNNNIPSSGLSSGGSAGDPASLHLDKIHPETTTSSLGGEYKSKETNVPSKAFSTYYSKISQDKAHPVLPETTLDESNKNLIDFLTGNKLATKSEAFAPLRDHLPLAESKNTNKVCPTPIYHSTTTIDDPTNTASLEELITEMKTVTGQPKPFLNSYLDNISREKIQRKDQFKNLKP